MVLNVKNMVCPRCISAVEEVLRGQGLEYTEVKLGEVQLSGVLDAQQTVSLGQALEVKGFGLLLGSREQTIEKIKNVIVKHVHYGSLEDENRNLSDILSQEIGQDYKQLSGLFSELSGTTIEKYYIQQKIEKVKELISYGELSLKEIAYQMGYSSEAYLSNQFKKVVGNTPTQYKSQQSHPRIGLDKV